MAVRNKKKQTRQAPNSPWNDNVRTNDALYAKLLVATKLIVNDAALNAKLRDCRTNILNAREEVDVLKAENEKPSNAEAQSATQSESLAMQIEYLKAQNARTQTHVEELSRMNKALAVKLVALEANEITQAENTKELETELKLLQRKNNDLLKTEATYVTQQKT